MVKLGRNTYYFLESCIVLYHCRDMVRYYRVLRIYFFTLNCEQLLGVV